MDDDLSIGLVPDGDAPTDEEEAAANAHLEDKGKSDQQLTDAERLAKLASELQARPTFASDRKNGEKVFIPGHEDEWFIPRPLSREEVLKLESIQAKARTWMKPGASDNAARAVDTQAKRDEYYVYLCAVGIAEYDLMSIAGRRRGKYAANPSNRSTDRDFGGLDPVVGEYVQLYLEVFNGISDEQRRERGNG